MLSRIAPEKELCWKVLEPVLHQKTRLWIGISSLVSCGISGALQPSIASLTGSLRLSLHTYLFFLFLSFFPLQLLPKTTPVVYLSCSPCRSASPPFSFSAVLLWETIIEQLPPLSNWFPFSLRRSSLFSALAPLWAVPCIHFSLQSFTISPSFFLFFSSHFFFFFLGGGGANFLHRCSPLPRSTHKYLCTLWTRYTQGQNSDTGIHAHRFAQPSSLGSRTRFSKFDFNRFRRFALFVRRYFPLSRFLFQFPFLVMC